MSDLRTNPTAVAAGSPAPGGTVGTAIGTTPAPKAQSPASAWSPLAVPIFRALWLAYLVSLIGTWAREAGGPWLMGILTDKQPDQPRWVSLIQTAGTLPIAILSIAAGVLADIYDRRKLLIWTNVWMLLASAGLAFMTLTGNINRESLLAMTLVLGIGTAMAGPAFQYVIPELVPPGELPLAIALNSVALNIARALGPAIAGAVMMLAGYYGMTSAKGTGLSFAVCALAFIGVIWVLARWKRAPQKYPAHPESLWSATKTAFAYTAHSPALRAILIRVAAFILCAVIVWSQLAIIAKVQLKGGELVYTIMMACVGFGAVVGVIFMPKMDKRFSTEGMVAICTAIFGLALIGLSQCHDRFANVWLAGSLAAVVGFNWVIVPTNFNIATQRSVPGWVKGRAIAMYMTVLFGSFAVGSPIWGQVSTKVGISNASLIAGSLILLGLALVKIFPLTRAMGSNFAPANQPPPGDHLKIPGPFEMVVEYAVDRARTHDFAHRMRHDLRRQRLRNGARNWQLHRLPAADEFEHSIVYEEVFEFANWSDRLRFNSRTTKADVAIEETIGQFSLSPTVVRYRPVMSYEELAKARATGRWIPTPAPKFSLSYVINRLTEEFDAINARIIANRFRKLERRQRERSGQ